MTIRQFYISGALLGTLLCAPTNSWAQKDAALPEAPSFLDPSTPTASVEPVEAAAAAGYPTLNLDIWTALFPESSSESTADEWTQQNDTHGEPARQNQSSDLELDASGRPIPLNRQQPKRILGFMPNFRSVSAGAKPHPPGWKYNFVIATHQAFDYSSFIFLGLTTISAEGLNEHPVLGKGIGGFYAYGWRGFLDKTDGTYLGAWFLPSLLHEDTRYYPLGDGHKVVVRALYVISRQGVTRTYGGRQTPNIAGLGGKVLTQIVSRTYYPTGATSFGVLAEKFGYAAMRDVAFTSIREFYPDVAAHYIRKHREKVARQAAADASAAQASLPAAKPQN